MNSDTPRTDALFEQFGPVLHPAVMAYNSLARELERENAKLREDKARLDWLESCRGQLNWSSGEPPSRPAVGTPKMFSQEAPTVREAIDIARNRLSLPESV